MSLSIKKYYIISATLAILLILANAGLKNSLNTLATLNFAFLVLATFFSFTISVELFNYSFSKKGKSSVFLSLTALGAKFLLLLLTILVYILIFEKITKSFVVSFIITYSIYAVLFVTFLLNKSKIYDLLKLNGEADIKNI